MRGGYFPLIMSYTYIYIHIVFNDYFRLLYFYHSDIMCEDNEFCDNEDACTVSNHNSLESNHC
jgi:hypothetical protein